MKQIHKLTIRDFLGVEAVDIDPGKMTAIAGGNGQGKTSVLKAIRAGLEGMPQGAVRQGRKKAEILVNLTDGLQIERTATAKGTYLKVRDSEGRQLPKPQGLLNSLRGAFAFNPVEFLSLDAKQQRTYVLQAMPVQLPDDAKDPEDPPHTGEHPLEYLQRRAKTIEADRRALGREKRDAEGQARLLHDKLADQPLDGEAPEPEQAEEAERQARDSLVRVQTQHEHWQRGQQRREELTRSLKDLETRLAIELQPPTVSIEAADEASKAAREKANELRRKLKAAEAAERKAESKLYEAREAWSHHESEQRKRSQDLQEAIKLRDEIETLDSPAPDVDTAQKALHLAQNAAQAAFEASRARETEEQWKVAEKRVQDLAVRYDRHTKNLDRYRSELPAELVRQHAEKLEGLEIGEDGLTWKGRPLANLADSERLTIALTIVQQLAGELRVICVDGLEKLSADRRAEFLEAVANDEFQYFVTRVGDPEQGELAIQSGKLVQGELDLGERQ